MVKTFNDRFHQRRTGFSLFKYCIGYFVDQSEFVSFFFNYHYLVSSIKKSGQIFSAVRQLKLGATSSNGQVCKTRGSALS